MTHGLPGCSFSSLGTSDHYKNQLFFHEVAHWQNEKFMLEHYPVQVGELLQKI